MKKITLSTIKSFIRNNKDNLYVKTKSSFDGMTDGIEQVKDSFRLVPCENIDFENKDTFGINGAWFVGGGRNNFEKVDVITKESFFEGFQISNCCGTFQLVKSK
jgi:hypothetical protein